MNTMKTKMKCDLDVRGTSLHIELMGWCKNCDVNQKIDLFHKLVDCEEDFSFEKLEDISSFIAEHSDNVTMEKVMSSLFRICVHTTFENKGFLKTVCSINADNVTNFVYHMKWGNHFDFEDRRRLKSMLEELEKKFTDEKFDDLCRFIAAHSDKTTHKDVMAKLLRICVRQHLEAD